MKLVHHHEPTTYTKLDTTQLVNIQNPKVAQKVLALGISAFVVATAAKHGIVNILKLINASRPGTVTPDTAITASKALPPSPTANKPAAKVPIVATTFSFATNPMTIATAKIQLYSALIVPPIPNPNGVKIGLIIFPNCPKMEF
ncbi:MAG: hypothetical protein EZS28_038972 [Streblomastix strix]|uniref:Uncharacterized protein n=1 Tax=Streblomastix strix TaxID=222440 RepID=A0A5J4U6J6_9EUKA|nr:MAG: hypothetical protein EZS28_038972 [Streblomastix strix]